VGGESINQEEPEKVHFDASKPELYFQVGVNLSLSDKDDMMTLLQEFRDIFAWSVYEAPGVSSSLACHSLAIPADAKPVQQRRRKLAPERSEIVMEEVGNSYESFKHLQILLTAKYYIITEQKG
jgi:hypothetical protein